MNITNRTSFVGFLVALSALSVPNMAAAATPGSELLPQQDTASITIEGRLSRLSTVLRERAEQLPSEAKQGMDTLLARGFADGSGRGWVDGARTGWADGYRGDFVNRNAWGNGWGDGGGFSNWHNY